MSHPDPLYDSDNSYEDDMNYDDHDDFYGESMDYDDYNDDMDGDHDSAMSSCGWGTDEDYGYYGDPEDSNDYGYEDFHSDDGYGYYDDGE